MISSAMIHNCNQTRVTVVRLGPGLDQSYVRSALGIANKAQSSFRFVPDIPIWPLDETYRLPNGGYMLDQALEDLLSRDEYRKFERPVVAFSALPLGDREFGEEADYFYFSSSPDLDPKIVTISTYPLNVLKGTRMQDYILLMLGTNILSTYGNLEYHYGTPRECLFDYCDDFSDAIPVFKTGKLCADCETQLEGSIPVDQLSAAIKIVNRAVHRSSCFVVMPFDDEFDPVYDAIREGLTKLGWDVKRSDDRTHPRNINDRVIREIMSSDLIVADLTGNNQNVFYEVGLAVALASDIVLLTQDKFVPFDLNSHFAVLYGKGEDRLIRLKENIMRSVGKAPWIQPK